MPAKYPPDGIDWFREHERFAVAKLGFKDSEWAPWRENFVAIETRAYFGSVGGSGVVTKAIGETELSSGVTPASYKEIFWDDSAGGAPDLIIPGGSSGQWAIYGRMRFTALDANTRTTFGVRNALGTHFVRLGVVGTVNALNFIVQSDAANIDSGVVDDTTWRNWLVVRKGIVTSLYFDGVLKGSANLFPASHGGPHAIAYSGSATAMKLGMEFVGAVFPRQVT